jgi:hypothetical protein
MSEDANDSVKGAPEPAAAKSKRKAGKKAQLKQKVLSKLAGLASAKSARASISIVLRGAWKLFEWCEEKG